MGSQRPASRRFEDALSSANDLALKWLKQTGPDPTLSEYLGLLPYPETWGPDPIASTPAHYLAFLHSESSRARWSVDNPELVNLIKKYWNDVDHYGQVKLSPPQRLSLIRFLAETNASAQQKCPCCGKLQLRGEFDGNSTHCRSCLQALGERIEPRPRGRPFETHGDDFIRVAAQIYAKSIGKRHEVSHKSQRPVLQPFARFLCLVGMFLNPPARTPRSLDAFVHNARDVVARRRGAFDRRWRPADGFVEIQITAHVALGGHPPGALLKLPAMEGKPVDQYWRRRLDEAAVAIVRTISTPKEFS
jgi:hypothetical protein